MHLLNFHRFSYIYRYKFVIKILTLVIIVTQCRTHYIAPTCKIGIKSLNASWMYELALVACNVKREKRLVGRKEKMLRKRWNWKKKKKKLPLTRSSLCSIWRQTCRFPPWIPSICCNRDSLRIQLERTESLSTGPKSRLRWPCSDVLLSKAARLFCEISRRKMPWIAPKLI